MKFKEKVKRFWTLDVHGHEGFTLVELIIVIAILAILSSVAVVGYSSYVEKANKQADLTLAAEIENVLMLAYYSDELTVGDYVIIKFDGTAVAGNSNDSTITTAADAMQAAYGDNWQTALHLKWAGWKDEMGVAANNNMMQAVKDSNFKPENLESLLEQVQAVVDLAAGGVGSVNITDGLLLDAAIRAGVTLDADGKVTSDADAQAVANALVFSVAGDITKGNVEQDEFAEQWLNYAAGDVFDYPNMNAVSKAAVEYAAVLSMAQYIDSQTNGTTQYALDLQNDPDAKDDRETFRDNMLSEAETLGVDLEGYMDKYENDAKAFLAYMNGVDASFDSMIQETPLNSDSYFANGNVLSYVKDYVSIGDALSGANVESGAFVFVFNGETISCLPLDY